MTVRHVLITRPVEEAQELAAAVRDAGFVPLVSPFLRVTLLPDAVPDLSGAQALVFTSAHAVRAAGTGNGTPVFAVGAATAAAARRAGFTDVRTAGGDADSLAAMIMRAQLIPDRPVLYLSGRDIATPLDLPGLDVRRHIVYHADKIDKLSYDTAAALTAGTVAAMLLLSVRTGEAFAAAIADEGLTTALSSTKALCISDSVLQSVAHLPWRGMAAARRPDIGSLCALLADTAP